MAVPIGTEPIGSARRKERCTNYQPRTVFGIQFLKYKHKIILFAIFFISVGFIIPYQNDP